MTSPAILQELQDEGALAGISLRAVGDAQRLKGHASTRQFLRITDAAGRTAILVVYPREGAYEAIERHERTTDWFAAAGIRVPRMW